MFIDTALYMTARPGLETAFMKQGAVSRNRHKSNFSDIPFKRLLKN